MVKLSLRRRQQPASTVDSSSKTWQRDTKTRQTMSAHQTNPLKRPRTDSTSRRTHSLSNIQQQPPHTEPAAQDEVFAQAQLLRSICTALAIVGYDSVKPSALEMFRAQVQEYMMHFLSTVNESMTSSRRTTPIPQDFILALAEAGISSHHLDPHLDLRLPPSISSPAIPPPPPAEPPPPDLAPMLGRDLSTPPTPQYAYIPSHFPPLPSRHAWQSTAVFTEREHDPRRIRERATDEGVMAEHALRKLTSANKTRSRARPTDKAKDQLWQDTISDILADEAPFTQRRDADGDIKLDSFDGVGEEKGATAELMRSGGGLLVNHDRGHWRRGRGAVHI